MVKGEDPLMSCFLHPTFLNSPLHFYFFLTYFPLPQYTLVLYSFPPLCKFLPKTLSFPFMFPILRSFLWLLNILLTRRLHHSICPSILVLFDLTLFEYTFVMYFCENIPRKIISFMFVLLINLHTCW